MILKFDWYFSSPMSVLLKFIQVYPELRDTLWTLDEDGEVSGTVTLMLGSLMMRGALHGAGDPAPLPPQPMEEVQQPMEQTDQPMEQTGSQQEQRHKSETRSQEQESEPCDTS